MQGEVESEGPSESECRPYIEKALKELEAGDAGELGTPGGDEDSNEDVPTVEVTTDDSDREDDDGDDDDHEDEKESAENEEANDTQSSENKAEVT